MKAHLVSNINRDDHMISYETNVKYMTIKIVGSIYKGGLILESFSLWLKSPKKGA